MREIYVNFQSINDREPAILWLAMRYTVRLQTYYSCLQDLRVTTIILQIFYRHAIGVYGTYRNTASTVILWVCYWYAMGSTTYGFLQVSWERNKVCWWTSPTPCHHATTLLQTTHFRFNGGPNVSCHRLGSKYVYFFPQVLYQLSDYLWQLSTKRGSRTHAQTVTVTTLLPLKQGVRLQVWFSSRGA